MHEAKFEVTGTGDCDTEEAEHQAGVALPFGESQPSTHRRQCNPGDSAERHRIVTISALVMRCSSRRSGTLGWCASGGRALIATRPRSLYMEGWAESIPMLTRRERLSQNV